MAIEMAMSHRHFDRHLERRPPRVRTPQLSSPMIVEVFEHVADVVF